MGSLVGGPLGAPPPSPPISSSTSETTTQPEAPQGGVVLDGKWCYRLKVPRRLKGKAAIKAFHDKHLTHVAFRGYKIAIKIKKGQTAELSFLGMKGWFTMLPSATVAADAQAAMAAAPDEQWVGFEPPEGTKRRPSFPAPGHICYRYKLTVTPVEHPPQAVVLLVTYPDVPFRSHYLMDVRLLSRGPKAPKRVTTTVSALF